MRYAVLMAAVLCAEMARAGPLPEDTNAIKTLTVEQARRLAETFPGVRADGLNDCLPLNGLKSLNADVARALAKYDKGPLLLNGLTTLDAQTAQTLASFPKWTGRLPRLTALEAPDAVATARALAARPGRLRLTGLKRVSPKTLAALIEKRDVEIPLIETLEFIREPDGSTTEDFVIPDWLEDRQRRAGGSL